MADHLMLLVTNGYTGDLQLRLSQYRCNVGSPNIDSTNPADGSESPTPSCQKEKQQELLTLQIFAESLLHNNILVY